MAALQMLHLRPSLLLVAAVLVLGALPAPAEAQTVTVTNTADSGPGSLREAIAVVNAGSANAINMTGLAGAITLVTPLPAIVNPVTIIGAGAGLTIDGAGGDEVLLNTGADVTIADFVIGDAFTKDGAGTLRWGGTAQTFTGETLVGTGVLRMLTNGVLSAASSVVIAPDAALDLAGTNQTVGDLTVAFESEADLGAGTLTVNGSAMIGTTVSGTLSGAGGSVHVTDDALFFVGVFGTGQGTYTGTTRASGNAQVGLFGDQILSAQSGLLLEDNALVQIDGANTFASLAGTGGELFLCDCTSVTFDQDIDTTFSGALSGDAASTFIKDGTGRLTLTGDGSAFLGTMQVSGGVLEGTTDSLVGDIVNNATVEFNQDVDGAYAGEMSGGGALVKSGTGVVELLSTSSYTGGTTVDAGTLVVGADDALGFGSLTMNGGTLQVDFLQDVSSLSGAAGTVLVNGELGIDQDLDTTFGGILAGSGDLLKAGDGMLTLTGANTFDGEVSVAEGVLALGGAGALADASLVEIVAGAEVRLLSDQTLGDVFLDGTLAVGSHTLTIAPQSIGAFLWGDVTGDGAIVVDGDFGIAVDSTLAFSGSLTFSNNSSSVLFADNALANASSITINDNAYLEVEGLQTFQSLSGNGGELFMCFCATVTVDQDIDTTFAGNITDDGSGVLVKAGTGRLMLAGTSSYLGGTTVLGGTLAGTTNSLQGAIVNDAIVEFEQAFDGEFDGAMSGTGSVIKSGTGTVEFTAANTYTGGTTVNAGTLVADDDAALGAGALTVNGGLLAIGGSNDVNVAVTALSGSGGAIEIAASSALIVDQATDTTFGGALTGDGFLQKTGGGTLSFDGAALGGAALEVTEGGLALASEDVVAGAEALVVDGGHVTLGANQTTDTMVLQVDGASSVDLGANTLTFGGSSGAVVMGTMAGEGGSLHVRGDAQVIFFLGGQGTYTGTTTVSGNGELYLGEQSLHAQSALVLEDDGYVEVGGALTIGALSGTGGELFFCACGGLTIDQDIDTTFAGAIASDVGAGSLIKAGSGRLLLTGASTYQGGTTVTGGILAGNTANLKGAIVNNATVEFAQDGSGTFTGVMSGTGALLKSGNGTVSLTAANTYTGGTTLQAGTLVVDAPGALGSGGLTVNAGLLDLNASHTVGALAGTGGTVDIVTTGVLTVDQASSTTFAGALTGGGGLTKSGAGTLMLTGTSSYTGGTTVLGGTLAGQTGSLQGAILNNARLEFVQDGDGAFDGVVSGTGSVVKSGGGTLVFGGANSYSGGTTIAAGTLMVASDASLGDGAGALTFAGGTLGLLGDFDSTRDVVLNASGTFDTGAHDALLAGSLTGAGAFTKTGSGALLLTGAASHTGGTNVLDGVLVGDTASIQKNILNQALVVFDQTGDGTFGGSMSGSGSVVKLGAGDLAVAGVQTYSGDTIVFEGGLRLDGSLAGSVFVDSGATFSGSGAVAGGVFVNGTFTAGGLPGGAGGGGDAGAGAHAVIPPMVIDGDLLLTSTAVYQAQVDEDAGIATLAVGGTAIIDGATLHLVETAAGIDARARRVSSTVMTADEVIGGFGSITGLGGSFDPYFFGLGSTLNLMLVRNDVDFASFASSPNGSAVGAALAEARAGASGDLLFVTREIGALETDAEVAAALDRITGAAHASVAGISRIGTTDALDVLTSRLAARSGWWLQGFGSALRLEPDVDPLASATDIRGALAGYDRGFGPMRIGVAAGYQDTGVDASGGLDRIDGRAYRAALYGQYRAGRLFVDGVLAAASHAIRGSRGIDFAARLDPRFGGGLLFGGVSRTAAFDYGALELAAAADAGYAVTLGPLTLEPAAGLQVTRFAREGFTESGADSLDLSAADASTSGLAARARLSVERTVDRAAPRWLSPRASVRYTRELGDRAVPFAATIAGAAFTAGGFAIPQSLLAAQAGIAAGFGAVTLSIDYRAAVAAGHRHHLISAGFGF